MTREAMKERLLRMNGDDLVSKAPTMREQQVDHIAPASEQCDAELWSRLRTSR